MLAFYGTALNVSPARIYAHHTPVKQMYCTCKLKIFKREWQAPEKKKSLHSTPAATRMHAFGRAVCHFAWMFHSGSCTLRREAGKTCFFLCIFCKRNKVLAASAGLEGGPPASCNRADSPSSADTQYHLSEYLDNWIWAGSRSGHYNQWHCQQCHWEPASSRAMGLRDRGRGRGPK